jgi:DNA-binding LytR/AlgR family response regulator
MINLAICDDEEKELNRTKEMCINGLSAYPEHEIKISLFSCSRKFLQAARQEQFDIVLLDIYMPEPSGIELARELRAMKQECQIIFLTTSTAHAIEAFSLHATHYLVKPYELKQLNDALAKAIATVNKNQRAQVILKVSGGVQKIYYKDFLYSETERHIQKIHMNDNNVKWVRITSTELFELLSKDSRFFKCGSTFIVNMEKVEEITTQYIIFENDEKLPMLRRQYKELLKRYTEYSLEGIQYEIF